MKKSKRNPKLDESYLTDKEITIVFERLKAVLIYGDVITLSKLMNLLRIGMHCTDCNRLHSFCKCEKCDECSLPKCMCDYKIDRHSTRNEVRKFAWDLSKELLSVREFIKFRDNLLNDLPKAFNAYHIELEGYQYLMKLIGNSMKR